MTKRYKVIAGLLAGILIAGGTGGYLVYNNMNSINTLDISSLTTSLTAEQRAKDIAKYYHEMPAAPSEEILKALKTPLSQGLMYDPEEMDVFLEPDFHFQNGYGILENGVAYAATETVMEGVSKDMYNFYNAWSNSQNDEELIYKIWYPGYHYTQTPNMTIVEDIGMGAEIIRFFNGEGTYSKEKANENNMNVTLVNGSITPINGGADLKAILLHVKFENMDGNFVDRCIVWFGCYWNNGAVTVDMTGLEAAETRAEGMAYHSAGENANLAAVIREVYEDQKDSFDMSTVRQGRGIR